MSRQQQVTFNWISTSIAYPEMKPDILRACSMQSALVLARHELGSLHIGRFREEETGQRYFAVQAHSITAEPRIHPSYIIAWAVVPRKLAGEWTEK